jgi:Fe-S-cluster-containing dehydrogenase component/formate-dependent nitrite reductase membrane component NrfD
MNYGFVIDNRRCIGCHACSTACKSENGVPLGVNRTWVKYVETGAFPDNRRHFQVTRCNHCANPPCVRICPVTAMYQRDDGIVEFDPRRCIGCKACLQACPYDAIYLDPDTHTAAKCHFCAHRLEGGLEPACVVVCPTEAILWGDLDDAQAEVSRLVARENVTVRKPEQGTAPKLFYVDGSEAALRPTVAAAEQATYLWADIKARLEHEAAPGEARSNGHAAALARGNGHAGRRAPSGAPLRAPQPQGLPSGGPLALGGRNAEHMIQVSYNAQHEVPWHWPVPAYLVTKGLAAGIFVLLALALGLGWAEASRGTVAVTGGVALAFVAVTTGLLVYDLEKPSRFLSILLRPQWRSWLVRGAYLLVGFATVLGLWWAVEVGGLVGVLPERWGPALRPFALWLGLPLAVGTAVYTAFLFGQAEGRDLWQSSLLPVHLLIQAVMMGGAGLLLVNAAAPLSESLLEVARVAFVAAVLADLLAMGLGEVAMPHASETAARAAHDMLHGRYRRHFWWGGVVLGHVVPLLLVLLGPVGWALAALAAIAGLSLYEYAFVMAPQHVPNS